MAKQKIGGKHRHTIKLVAKATIDVGQDGPTAPAHAKRKIARKFGFLDRVKASSAAALKTKAGVKKHKPKRKAGSALPDLATLGESLAELTARGQLGGVAGNAVHRGLGHSIKGDKGRKAISAPEIARVAKVLHHPTYQANPLEAIKHHIAASAAASTKTAKLSAPKGSERGQKSAGHRARTGAGAGRGAQRGRGQGG